VYDARLLQQHQSSHYLLQESPHDLHRQPTKLQRMKMSYKLSDFPTKYLTVDMILCLQTK
jgi:hypothetical protein